MEKTISIPFSAWDGIFRVAAICKELRRNEMFASVPNFRTPRDITIRQRGAGDGFGDRVVVKYWVPGGSYATAALGGTCGDENGTSWTLVGLRLRWVDAQIGLHFSEKDVVSVRLTAEQLRLIARTAYLRSHLRDFEGHPNLPAARQDLAAAEAISDAVIADLAAPIRAACARQQAWLAECAATAHTAPSIMERSLREE